MVALDLVDVLFWILFWGMVRQALHEREMAHHEREMLVSNAPRLAAIPIAHHEWGLLVKMRRLFVIHRTACVSLLVDLADAQTGWMV